MEKLLHEIIEKTQIGVFDYIENPPHLHKEIELCYLAKGEMGINCEGKEYFLQKGDFFLVMPNLPHFYIDKGKYLYYYIVTDTRHLRGFDEGFNNKKPICPLIKSTDNTVLELYKMALEEHSANGNTFIFEEIISAMFSKIMRHCDFDSRSNNNDKISQIFNYLSRHYKEDITLESVANALYINKYYLSHTLTEKLNINFRDYINQLRIDEALRLIEQENKPITKAALEVGFLNARTFNRAFKKRFDKTPKE